MGLKRFKPTTSGLRHTIISDFSELTKGKPEKSLLVPIKKSGGRNVYGRITARFIGGGHKKMYRLVDFRRARLDEEAIVLAVEYDPNRSARIALIQYPDKVKAYILCPLELKVGDKVMSTISKDVEIKPGNCLPLRKVPLGTAIHNIEIKPGRGGKMVRSAGTSAQMLAREGDFALVRMPSSEVRKIHIDSRVTIGQLGNVEHESISIGKAGRNRWKGRLPHVRGAAMNAVDHPHGGGEGKAPQGNPHPVSPWGMATKGFKTRKKRKYSNPHIVNHRGAKSR